MNLNYKFTETHNESYFATISRLDIDDPALDYIFPLNYKRDKCYKIDRPRLKSLVDDGTITYNIKPGGVMFIREVQYKRYFEKIAVDEAKQIVEPKQTVEVKKKKR